MKVNDWKGRKEGDMEIERKEERKGNCERKGRERKSNL